MKVGSGVGAGAGSGSISLRYGFADPDPHQNVTDPQHWLCIRWWSLNFRFFISFLEL
jgi:hypothetical protein